MTGRLDGRTAIVTGASRGLGRSIALALAAEGANVAVVARTEAVWNDKLPGTIGETVADIEASRGSAIAVRADLLNRDDLPRLVDETRAAFGPVTVLVNNAAFTAPGRPPTPGAAPVERKSVASGAAPQADWPAFVGTPVHAFRRHFEIAVFAAYELMQLVVPDMIASGGGAIVNISSVASRVPGLPGYGGSKAALEHLTLAAAYELSGRNVSVNALSPSQPMATPGLSYYRTGFENEGSPDEFAEAVVRLALVDPADVTGRTVGHLEVLDGSFRPFEASHAALH